MKPVILIAGGGHSEVPLIRASQRLGYRVITTGNRPDDLGHVVSDEYFFADYSSYSEMLALARQHEVDAICAGCNDFAALSAAYVAQALGLPGHDSVETAMLIHHKDRFRQLVASLGFPSPRAVAARSVAEAEATVPDLRLPVLVKPVDLTGGKGISKVSAPHHLGSAVESALRRSRSGRVVVEEFIEGTRHGFSCFLRNREVVFAFVDDEYYFRNPFLVSGASSPGNVPARAKADLVAMIQALAGTLRLVDGIFHLQFVLRDEEPFVVDVCRRAPGDLYVNLVERATGVDYSDWIVRAAAGLDVSDVCSAPQRGYHLRHCVMAEQSGSVVDVEIDPRIAGAIVDQVMWWHPGSRIVDALNEKLGIVFACFDSEADMARLAPHAASLIRVIMESPS